MKKTILTLFVLSLLIPFFSVQAVEAGTLIKGKTFSAVYYRAQDGKRYVFPNQRIYNSWYEDFSQVHEITDEELANIPLGGNVFYKPNSRLVKMQTVPAVYWVGKNGLLKHIVSEEVAQSLFGDGWFKQVDILPEETLAGYTISGVVDFNNYIDVVEDNWTIDKNKQYQHQTQENNQNNNQGENNENQEQEQEQNNNTQEPADQLDEINLTVYLDNSVPNFKWSVGNNDTTNGFMLMKSAEKDFVYPGEQQVKLDGSASDYTWLGVAGDNDAYYKICLLDDEDNCQKYSDEESLSIGSTDKTFQIILSGQVEDGVAKLIWKREWINAKNGFYLMRSQNPNPEFSSSLKFSLDKEQESYNWEGMEPGTYNFRVCNYTGTTQNSCEYYSNNLELTIE